MPGSLEVLNMSDIAFLKNVPAFDGLQATVQSIPNSSWTSLSLDSSQFDNYGGHSNSVNNSRYTCVVPGWYTVSGTVAYPGSSTGARAVRIALNGNPYAGLCTFTNATATLPTSIPTPTREILLSVGDYVEVQTWQNTGGAISTTVTTDIGTGLWLRFSHF